MAAWRGHAAWVAADIAGVPFSTSARGDNLEPADPDLADKLSAALFVRANNAADQARIEAFDRSQARGKVALVYNSLTLPPPAVDSTAPVPGTARGKRRAWNRAPCACLLWAVST